MNTNSLSAFNKARRNTVLKSGYAGLAGDILRAIVSPKTPEKRQLFFEWPDKVDVVVTAWVCGVKNTAQCLEDLDNLNTQLQQHFKGAKLKKTFKQVVFGKLEAATNMMKEHQETQREIRRQRRLETTNLKIYRGPEDTPESRVG